MSPIHAESYIDFIFLISCLDTFYNKKQTNYMFKIKAFVQFLIAR